MVRFRHRVQFVVGSLEDCVSIEMKNKSEGTAWRCVALRPVLHFRVEKHRQGHAVGSGVECKTKLLKRRDSAVVCIST